MVSSRRFLRLPLVIAGLAGSSGVGLGALGAHGLAVRLAEFGKTNVWDIAAKYQLYHALAMLAVGIWLRVGAGSATNLALWAIRSWTAGIFLFSGSLYWSALGGPRWLWPAAPIGGIIFMAGWLLVALAALRRDD